MNDACAAYLENADGFDSCDGCYQTKAAHETPPKPQKRHRRRFRRPRGCGVPKACQGSLGGPCPARGCNVGAVEAGK